MAGDPEEKRTEPQQQVLGAYLRAQRQVAALSLRQLAGMTDVSNAYLSQVERGLHQPSLKVLRSIAAALNLSTESLLSQAGFSDPAPPADADAEDGPTSTGTDTGTGAKTSTRADGGSGTETAIRNDPTLTQDDREALLAIYRQLRDHHHA